MTVLEKMMHGFDMFRIGVLLPWKDDTIDLMREFFEASLKEHTRGMFEKVLKDKHAEVDYDGVVKGHSISDYIIENAIDRLKPSLTYCAGMQEAIQAYDEKEFINGIRQMVGKYFITGTGRKHLLKRCPFCPDGSNCLEVSK